ncbi:MAG: hypothetical protein ABJD07_15730 [Gemmatimonadaceae bacterium]
MSETLFWVAVACCAIAQTFIVRSALKPNRADVQDGVPLPSRPSEIAWTIVPGIVLVVVFVLTWRAMHEQATAGEHRPAPAGALALAAPSLR